MTSIRAQILKILQTRQTATPTELSRALQVTSANIRHHLRNLARDGVVVAVGERPAQARGRPTQVYALANQGSNIPLLTSILLSYNLSSRPTEERTPLLKTFAAHLLEKFPNPPQAKGRHITQRLVNTISTLDTLNYQPRWEAHAEGPQIVLEHCPYAAILEDHPEICQVDAFLIENILEEPVTQTVKRQPNQLGIRYCLFKVGPLRS